MTTRFVILGIIFVLINLGTSGCERDTKIYIDGKVPPTFTLRGTGKVYFVRIVKSPASENDVAKNEGGIWQIDPDEKMRETNISRYPSIKYGEVPKGFIQRIPREATDPPKLEEGQEYLLLAPTYNANFEIRRFKVQEGKSILLP